jgi:hypothetical protein
LLANPCQRACAVLRHILLGQSAGSQLDSPEGNSSES